MSRTICLTMSLLFGSGLLAATSVAQDAPEEKESPWLLTPTISSDPKLGTNIGAMGAYLHQFDEASNVSMFGGFANYSDTDSYMGGGFGDMYWNANQHKIIFGAVGGTIRNEYEDFLGSGLKVKTEDDLKVLFFRYSQLVAPQWYVGGQVMATNYAIGAEGIGSGILDLIGLTGFDSNGLGLVAEFDSRDNVRNATKGQHFVVHNIAYRESLGGDESFDALNGEYVNYLPFGDDHVLAIQVQGRWTHDAPLGGYSSVTLRGYTRGNYLDEHYTHIDADARFHISGPWGVTAFAGLGCLYAKVSDCSDSEDLYASAGAGVSYLLKPEAGVVIRAEYAVGEKDNSAFYLRIGQPF
ncbi:MAG: BamA/TamA family outer membrane protein [Halioglobus sp.]